MEHRKARIPLQAGTRNDNSPVRNGKERGFHIVEAVVRINNYIIIISGRFRTSDQIKVGVHSYIVKLQIPGEFG